ncbi:MAG: quinone-dependent dihydroorotate dehydrogenase [Gemmatimonadota bacterium]
MPILYPLARTALFALPAEKAHEIATGALARLPAPARGLLRARNEIRDRRLATSPWGIDLPNPVGLAAGFDKSAAAFNALGALGFGFVEIGTITALPQPGNPRPRLFRLPSDQALLNRMGFNNPGAEAVGKRLEGSRIETVLGINVGKSKVTPLDRAVDDYLRSIELLEPYARYLVINVSSPNTPGLRELQDAEPLRKLLRAVLGRESHPLRARPPVLLKLAPDLTDPQLDEAVDIAVEEGVSGIVAVNTTISREGLRTPASAVARLGAGGISGAPVRERAEAVVRRIFRRTGGTLPIVGVGGIFSADDAWKRIRAGASLVQLYTGFVYGGPGIVRRINAGLLERLDRYGFATVADAVGTGAEHEA